MSKMKKLLIVEIDESFDNHKFKINDKVTIEGTFTNTNKDYAVVRGIMMI